MNHDHKLRQKFQELRNTDAQRVPAFSRVARSPVPTFAIPWWRFALGVAGLVTVIFALMMKRQSVTDTQQWMALSNWRATTDELLTVSSTPWGSTISTPTDSWIENSTQTNQMRNL